MADNTNTGPAPSPTPNIDRDKAKRRQEFGKMIIDVDSDPELLKNIAEFEKILSHNADVSEKTADNLKKVSETVYSTGKRMVQGVQPRPPGYNQIFNPANPYKGTPYSTLSDASGFKSQKQFDALNGTLGTLNDSVVKLTDVINNGPKKRGWSFFTRRPGSSNPNGAGNDDTDAQEKRKRDFLMIGSLMGFVGKKFDSIKESISGMRDRVSGLFDGIKALPKKLVNVIQNTAMAIPNGIVAFTTKLLGGAGKALGKFFEGLAASFKKIGGSAPLIIAGAGAMAAIAGTITLFGVGLMATGKGIEMILTGISDGITGLVNSLHTISNTDIDTTKIVNFGKTLNDFFGTQSAWNEIKAIVLRLVPDFRELAQSLSDISKMDLNHDRIVGIGKTIGDFLESMGSIKSGLGAIVSRVIDPANVQQFATVLNTIKGYDLPREQLLATAETLGAFLTALGSKVEIWKAVKAWLADQIQSRDLYTNVAANLNTLATIKPMSHDAVDGLYYFLDKLNGPLATFITAGTSYGANNLAPLYDTVKVVKEFAELEFNPGKLASLVDGADAVKKASDILANVQAPPSGSFFGGANPIDSFISAFDKLDAIKDNGLAIDKLEKFTKLADGMNAMADAINRTTDAINRLNGTKPVTDEIMGNVGAITAADVAQRMIAATAAQSSQTAVSSTVNNVANTTVTNAYPAAPNKTPSPADSALGRGR